MKPESFIPPEDLEVSVTTNTQRGGQQVGVTETEVKVLHRPSGIYAVAKERSQHKSKRIALAMVEYGLLEMGWRYEA